MDNTQQLLNFIGTAKYDEHGGGQIWGVDPNGGLQMLADVRGWGAIQNLFKNDLKLAAEFQDNLGKFFADAINEKVERTRTELGV